MRAILAVARQTFSQCLRMKLALVVMGVLAVSLVVMPLFFKGDATLAGQIRTLLSYGISLSTVLLSVLTLLVTVGIVTEDVRQKTIVLLAVKPLSRWEYILGRWLGVVMLNAILCVLAFGSIYLAAQYLRDQTATTADDRSIVETQVFAARKALSPLKPNFEKLAAIEIEKLRKSGKFEELIAAYEQEGDRRKRSAEARLYGEILNKVRNRYEVVASQKAFYWRFEGVNPDDLLISGNGKILGAFNKNYFDISADRSILGSLRKRSPVLINKVEAFVLDIQPNYFRVSITDENLKRPQMGSVKVDSDVDIVIMPMFQLKFRIQVPGEGIEKPPSIRRVIGWGKPLKPHKPGDEIDIRANLNQYNQHIGTSKVGSVSSVNFMAYDSIEHDSIVVGLANNMGIRGPDVQIQYNSVKLLFRVGGFEANYLKGVLLVFGQLVLMSAMGLFFSSFLSFPVSMIACSVLLVGGLLFGWLKTAVFWGEYGGEGDAFTFLSKGVLWVVQLFVPDLSESTPAEKFVDGQYISWFDVLRVNGWSVGFRSLIYLFLGCGIFTKRELSKVQV